MKRGLCILVILALAGAGLSAENIDFGFNGVAFNFAILPIPLPTGADIQFGLTVAEPGKLPLDAVLRLRGGYEDNRLLRDPVTGDPVASPDSTDPKESFGIHHFNAPDFQWALGLVQGLVAKDKGNLLEAFAFYRGRFDIYNTSLVVSRFSDTQGMFGTSFLAGLAYDSVSSDSRRVKSGSAAELSGEWGPEALNTLVATTDFWRIDLKAEGYMPLLSIGQGRDEGLNAVSIYLAGFASVDYAGGKAVPIWVMQSFGGRDLRSSLGDCVRGYPTASYDASFKTVANGEIRVLGPALFAKAWFVPSVYVFCDAGYYSGFAGSDNESGASGTIMSTGAGFNLDIFDFAYIGLFGGFKFPGSDVLYSTYGETDPFFWKIGFLLHF